MTDEFAEFWAAKIVRATEVVRKAAAKIHVSFVIAFAA